MDILCLNFWCFLAGDALFFKIESKNKEVENQSERKPDANLEQVEIQKTSLASQALDQSEIEQKRMNSEKMWSKWADWIKIDLTKQLTLEELNLLNSKCNFNKLTI